VVDARKPVKRQPVVEPVVDVPVDVVEPDPVESAPVEVAPEPEPVVEPAVVPVKAADKRSATMLELQRTMSQGDHGPRVEVVQKALADAGFFEGKQDGRYGTLLGRAVRQFQGSKGLRVTGEVNPQTWEALFS
jgi:peptidoglycan hydrolase-like protein with peptidoglycan-binding domain